MQKLTSKTKKELEKIGVVCVYLFGSQADGTAGQASDFDVAVIFDQAAKAYDETGEIYNQLYDIFSNLFDLSGFKNIDIIFLQNTNLQLRYQILTTGKILYQKKPDLIFDYKAKTMLEYADFSPLRNMFNQAVLERI